MESELEQAPTVHEEAPPVKVEEEVGKMEADDNHNGTHVEENIEEPEKEEIKEEEIKEETENKERSASPVETTPAQPKRRGRPPKSAKAGSESVSPSEVPASGKGRKRTRSGSSEQGTPVKKGARAHALHWSDFVTDEGDRVLSCGEGEQLGHPGRSTTKKPRKVDIVEENEFKIKQVAAGGVHSVILTADNRVFSCGMNEKGTVPVEGVEPEGSTDEFTEIKFPKELNSHGKIVMLATGASFTAGLTDKGSVIAWGNLRDSSGEVDVHPLLHNMKAKPTVIISYKKRKIAKIAAGENHLVLLSEDGQILTFGEGSMGQLGRTRRTGHIRPQYMVDESGSSLAVHVLNKNKKVSFKDIFAGGFWTMAVSRDDSVYAFGLNNFGQLGIPVEDIDMDETKEEGENGEPVDERELRVFTPLISPEFSKKQWTHIQGVQHIVARSTDGEVYSIGKNTDNALGLGTWTGNDDQEHWCYSTLQKVELPCVAAGVSATLGASVAWSADGTAYAWGCDTVGQLGLGIKDDDDEKVVPKPQEVTSAHLDGYQIISISCADNHSLFLAKKKE